METTNNLNSNLWYKLFRAMPSQFRTSTIETAIMSALKYYSIPYYVDAYGNIFNVDYKDRPLLSAHIDSVQTVMRFPADMHFERTSSGHKFVGDYCLGADDKVGLYIIINYLKDHKNTNFVFSQEEETGCKGITSWLSGRLLKHINFGIVLDRRGGSDILCTQNGYGTKQFEDALVEVSANGGHGFTPARGLYSDTDKLKSYMSCTNLSVGYYHPHTDNEYVIMNEVFNTERFVANIIKEIGDTRFEKKPVKKTTYYNSDSGHSYNSHWGHQYRDDITKPKIKETADITRLSTQELINLSTDPEGFEELY